jgi:NADP-dependent 3-hydroxy acid dehydrogenase YdfG/acyl carrier protein/3-hydroxymyristoyl/3-hydroxydecanoyl-(acyl carrier protein) dehydratase
VTVAAPAQPVVAGSKEIEAYILQVVAEKTGYPTDMLDLELDLEGDLGIDTVKQAELFREIREHYGIPRREDLRLADYNTLQKVIGFVQAGLGAQAAPAPQAATAEPTPAAPQPVAAGTQQADVQAFVVALVSEKTGYPAEMLDLGLDLEGDLGIDTVKQAELFRAVREQYGIPRREDLRLADYNTLEKVIGFVMDAAGSQPASPTPVVMAAPVAAPASVAVTPQPPAAAQPVAPVVTADEDVTAYVLGVVAEKTGYPTEMLDLDLDLEGDLGVDTVKQAELFATIRTHYGIPRREDLRLSDYNTLRKVVGFMQTAVNPASAVESVVAAAPVEPPAVEAQPVAAGGRDDEIKAYVLSVVAEKTGYPVEMLDLELDLEGDLGIDTVKQAEVFATIRTHFGIPRREDLRLADYNTLEKVIGFMADALAPAPVEPEPPAPEPVAAEAAPEAPAVSAEPTEPVAIRRRVPVAVLRPRIELCEPTGIELGPESRVLIVADGGKVADSLARRLRGRKAQVLVAREDAVAQASAWAAEAPLTGVYFLRGLESPSSLADLTVEAWESERTNSLENLASLLREQTTLQFLVVATRMGGLHGVLGAAQPLNGLLTGFAKAVAMERPGLRVKAVDFEADLADSPLAARLVDETLSDPAVVEVGWEAEQRFTLVLQDQMVTAPARAVESGSVFLVSGGTGGITAPIVADLARRTQGKFYLTGRTQLTDRNDPDLAHLKEDRAGLKKALAERMSQAGAKVTPAQVERRVAELERSAAAWEAIGAVEAAGGAATYLAGDVSDAASVAALVQQVLDREGRVDVLIHAAGQDRSRKLENKSAEEFRGIVNVKAGGFLNLWRALAERGRLPRQVVAFTSVAGRFGNSGQTDYAAANDAVSKMIHAIRREHPQVQATAIDWGAWAEVGMASRGFIPELMQRAGIEMMAPEQAAPLVFAELTGGQGGEVVLSGKLGALEAQSSPTGGLNVERANQALTEGNPIHVMLSRATGLSLTEGVLLEAELHPDEPFLRDHALNGIPLLPGVMGIEGFSIAAQHVSSVLGSAKGGFRVDELEDVHFLAPFKLYRNQSRRITWKAQVVREVGGLVAHVRLESTLALKTRPDEVVQHFSGKVHLAPVQVALESAIVAPPVWNGAYTVQPEDIYKLYFHGPAFQVLDGVQRSGDSVLGKLNKNLPGLTSEENRMVSTPVLVELCLQTAGIWEVGATGTLALPRSIGCLKLYRTRVNGVPIFAEVVPTRDENGALSFDARVVDAKGHLYLELNNYRTVPLPYSVESDLLSPLKGLMETH